MTIGEVTFYEVDGQLGAVDSSTMPLAIAGICSAGPYTPTLINRISDLSAFGCGDLVEAAAVQIKDWKSPALICRANVAAAGTASLVTTGWTGTSTPTLSPTPAPIETGEYWILCKTAGVRGTAGAEFQISYDGGRTYGATIALGTDVVITLSASVVGTVVVALAAGTFIAGEKIVVRTVAPAATAAEITAAVDQLGVHVQDWDALEVSCPIDATIASALDASLATMSGRVKERYWQGNARLPTVGEAIAAYRTAMATAWGSYSTLRGHVWPGNVWFVSRLTGLKCKRPRVWGTAPYVERLPLQIDPAQEDNGAVPGMTLAGDDGNPELHDEQIHGGFDALRLCSLYQKGQSGVFVGNCRTKSPEGSDYRYVQIRRVINRGKRRLYEYLRKVLSKDVLVSKKTGKLTPSYVRLLKTSSEVYVGTAYSIGPMVSGFTVTPDANANVLSTEQVPFEFEVVPLGYIKSIPVKVIMKNPALSAG